MKRRIVLHIGSPKCGSTYLQRILLKNRLALARAGASYPDPPGHHPGNGLGFAGLNENKLSHLFGGPKESVQTLIFSHEDLFAQAIRHSRIAKLCRNLDIDIQVVAFLRPFSGFIFGDYSQFMKQNFESYLATGQPYEGQSFEEFAVNRSRNLTPLGYFRAWGRACTNLPVIVSGHHGISGVIERILGYPDLDWEANYDEINPSLRMQDCDDIAAEIRDGKLSGDEIRKMFRAAFKRTKDPDNGRTNERTAWIEAMFQKQNRLLLEEFGIDNYVSGRKSAGAGKPEIVTPREPAKP